MLNFCALRRGARDPSTEGVDCPAFMNAWNLFGDVAASVGLNFQSLESPDAGAVYDKLFWGCNRSVVTPPGERYVPQWSAGEVWALASVLREGLNLFARCVSVEGLLPVEDYHAPG